MTSDTAIPLAARRRGEGILSIFRNSRDRAAAENAGIVEGNPARLALIIRWFRVRVPVAPVPFA